MTTNTNAAQVANNLIAVAEDQAFEDWYKQDCLVGGVNARIAARAAWNARAALTTAAPQPCDIIADAVRVPLDSLHADASYLIGRLQRGTMTASRVVEVIRERIDAAKAALTTAAAPAAVASPLTKLQRKAIAVCFTSDKVSVSEVQRKLSISYADAQTLCQSIVDLGLTDELELAPSLKRGAPAPHPAPVAQGDALTYEQQWAIRQGHEIAASDSYFDARPQIDNNDRRKVFEAGFERGWDAARSQAKKGGAW